MKRILCLGDSNTFGYDPRSPLGESYPSEMCWTERLHARGFAVANCSQNGLDIATCLESLESLGALLARALPLDRVLVMLGTNDILAGVTAERTTERMEKLLAFLMTEARGARLLLLAPVPLVQTAWVPDEAIVRESARLGKLYGELAEKLGIDFADAGAWGVPLAFEGVHFSPEGHAVFAEKTASVLGAAEE